MRYPQLGPIFQVLTLAAFSAAAACQAQAVELQGSSAGSRIGRTEGMIRLTRTAKLTVGPPGPRNLTFSPRRVVGGKVLKGLLRLSRPAPAGGQVVALSSDNSAVVSVPASVTVPAGAITVHFPVTTYPVATPTSVTISGTAAGATKTFSLSLREQRGAPRSVSLDPASVGGGASATGAVTIIGPAPARGAAVTLSTDNPAVASVPASVTVPPGATTVTFPLVTRPVSVSTRVVVSCTRIGVTTMAALMVLAPAPLATAPRPITLASLTVSPAPIAGGGPFRGTVTLTGFAPPNGAVVALASDMPAVAEVPQSVTVTEGNATATFPVSIHPVATSTRTVISGSFGGATRRDTVITSTASAVNARILGARGNGVTDDTLALQHALNAAKQGTRRLYIPQGTYRIRPTPDGVFPLDADGLEVFGDGIGKTVIQIPDNVTLTSDLYVFRLTGMYQSLHDLSVYNGKAMKGPFTYYAVSVYAGCYIPHLYNLEVTGVYGALTAGGSGFDFYQPAYTEEISTSLGTNIAPGQQVVTPGSMKGIYVGRTLVIGGATERVVVTAVTETSFTATFANAHSSSDSVTSSTTGHQYAVVENCIARDSLKATGFIVNSSGNTFRNCKVMRVGFDARQHGFYIQGGQNVFDSNYVESVAGYSLHGHKQVPGIDGSGDVYVNNTSLNPGTQHMIVNSLDNDGTNPELPPGTPLTRDVTIIGNRFLRSANGPPCSGVQLEVPAILTNNTFEDAVGGQWAPMLSILSSTVVEGNTFSAVNTQSLSQFGVSGAENGINNIIRGNQFLNFGGDSLVVRLQGSGQIIDNAISVKGGTAILLQGPGVEIARNDVRIAGGTCLNLSVPGDVQIHDNEFTATDGLIADITDAKTNVSIYENLFNGVFQYSVADPGMQLYNNEGMISDSGLPAIPTRRTMGRLLAVRKAGVPLTAGRLVKLDAGGNATAMTTADRIFVGIATSDTPAEPGSVYLAGQPGTEFDGVAVEGSWSAGHYGVPSTTSPGKLMDGGTGPPANGSYVLFLDSGAASGNARVQVVETSP
jgi:Pectate lyase superfamily protein/Periplasmic copper-binding protein (NosD)